MRIALNFILLTACASTGSRPLASRAAKASAKPETYTEVFRELPLAASLSRLPWASENWSSVRGGSSFRWQSAVSDELEELEDLDADIHYTMGKIADRNKLSPTEKLDVFLGNKNWDYTVKERHRTLQQTNADGSPRKNIPEWEGIMHAWSIASLQFEPVGPVTIGAKDGTPVKFEAQDIYSLLSLYVHEQNPKPIVLAALCGSQSDNQELAAGAGPYAFENGKQAARRKGCAKIDAKSFHMVLANQIGKLNEGFIIDRVNQGEISNNPVVAYETRVIEGSPSAMAPSRNSPRKLHLRTILFLTQETPVLQMDEQDETYPYDTESFEYELDLDSSGRIVAGRWLSPQDAKNSVNTSIPDFMWKSTTVWLNGPVKTIYEQGRQSYASQKFQQLRPIEDMPVFDRSTLNAYFNNTPAPEPQ